MSKKLIVPNGWPCKLRDAPEGMFVTEDYPDLICFKTEYALIVDGKSTGRCMAFNSAGEYFCGNGDEHMVQPVMLITEDDD